MTNQTQTTTIRTGDTLVTVGDTIVHAGMSTTVTTIHAADRTVTVSYAGKTRVVDLQTWALWVMMAAMGM